MPPLSRDQARVQLAVCYAVGRITVTNHFREELQNDGLSMLDVERACRTGAVVEIQEPDPKTGQWKYRLEGRTVDGDLIAVVFAFRAEAHAVMITVFRR